MAEKIFVFSGKGGVGKSSVTAGLAKALTDLGKKVLCIDADIGFRSLDLILNVGNQVVYNWLDLIEGRCDADKAVLKVEHLPALLASPNEESDSITAESFKTMLDGLDSDYDYIFIDSPAGSDSIHKIIAKACDRALLIATPDNVCVRSAEVAGKKAEMSNENIDIRLIINRFNKNEVIKGKQLKLDDVIDSVHAQLIGVVPEDKTVRAMPDSDSLLSRKAELSFRRIAKRIIGENVAFNIKYFS